MKWLPYDSWTLDSELSIPALYAGMSAFVEPAKWFDLFRAGRDTPFWGNVYGSGFTVCRRVYIQNSFRPIVYGTFLTNDSGGTSIRIRMVPHPIVIAFMACWLGLGGVFALCGFLAGVTGQGWGLAFGAGGMFLFGLAMTYLGFWTEAGKTKSHLAQVLEVVRLEAADAGAHDEGTGAVPPPLPRTCPPGEWRPDERG